MKKIHFFFLGFILFIAFFLRFYKLGEVPYGFYQDESAIGYNAFSINQTGKDEYGNSFPLYFKSFGDYKLPVYIYLTAISEKIFGVNEFAVRFPSAFFGLLSVLLMFFFVKELMKNRLTQIEKQINADHLALLSAFLFAINPWALDYNRATFEVSVSLFLFLLGSYLILKSFEKKAFTFFLFGTLSFVLSLYSYNLTRLLAPVLYFLLLIINKDKLKILGKKEIIATLIILFIALFPFLKSLFQSGGVSSASGTLIFSSASVQAPLLEFKSYFVNSPFLSKLFFNNLELTFFQYLKNIISYLSGAFFFVSGSTHGNHGIGNFGQFYIFELPLVAITFIKIIREKLKWTYFLLFWAVAVILVAGLTRGIPHATRSFFLIIPFEVLSAIGTLFFLNWLKNIKSFNYKIFILSISFIFVVYNLVYYFSSYYVRFPILYAKSWRSEDKTLSLYIKENQQKYDKIIFDKQAGFIYTSLLFYLQYPPSEFQSLVTREPDDSEGFSAVKSFGKYEFKDITSSDYKMKRTLIVTTIDQKPNNIPSLMTLYYPKRPVVLSVGQNIIQYPVKDTAYVLVETK